MEKLVWLTSLVFLCICTTCQARSIRDVRSLADKKTCTCTDTVQQIESSNTGSSLPHVLRIGAFNIKTFGRSKMGDGEIANIITQIVLRYDVILIQEIRDSSQESIMQLWRKVNETRPYGLSLSARLGRTSYKEQYAYFYRLDRLVLIGSLQYNDESDLFEREPYSVRLRSVGAAAAWDFALIGLHAKPDHAVDEIDSLIEVYDDLRASWTDIEDVVLIGDFNAACKYASQSDLENLPIYNQDMFKWLLGFDADTTTSSNTDCAYDRIVVNGRNIVKAVIPGSEGIFRFENVFDLNYERMLDVSDHYPVEFEIY